jgi:hypothetical protein
MRLPKHRMAKTKPHKPQKRTSKHKNYKTPSIQGKNEREMEREMHTEEDDTNDHQEEENEESNEKEEGEQMDTQSDAPGGQLKLKSKEEKAAIRELRHKTNAKHNQWKRKNSNISGKNGPRAINRASVN